MNWWQGLLIGLFVGGNLGLLVAAWCIAAAKEREIPVRKNIAVRHHEMKFGTPEHPVDYPRVPTKTNEEQNRAKKTGRFS